MSRYMYLFIGLILFGCKQSDQQTTADLYKFEGEKHLKNIKMLTDEGENAEAYFSFDEKKLIPEPSWPDAM